MWGEPARAWQKEYDSRDLRTALGRFATGVCIVTTQRADGKREGLTINSFSSVSLNPPLVLWSLSRRAPSAAAFGAATFFAINVLAHDQQHLAQRFSRPAEDKFADLQQVLDEGLGGVPLFEGAVAHFQCRNSFQNYGGDHIVFVGSIERCDCWDRAPLLFYKGRYATLTPE